MINLLNLIPLVYLQIAFQKTLKNSPKGLYYL
jgi:hypothetical protein